MSSIFFFFVSGLARGDSSVRVPASSTGLVLCNSGYHLCCS
uniref:Uncharacterized protein n=1 Tax=Brassica campestris TaxID=3711 RepID=A0A3P6BMP4_BRACM|nr:unnamed protein product [Brassica rapa]